MKLRDILFFALSGLFSLAGSVAEAGEKNRIVTPTPAQADWQRKERVMFIHFGPAAFQGREFDNWSSDIGQMYLTKLDTDQWCEVARSWGARMIVFVAKHCGGFCWWQTETSDYGVRNIPWRDGQGDVMRDLAASCKKYGLDLGVYAYPGDEHWGAGIGSGGTTKDPAKQEAYNAVYRQQLTELLSRYGTLKEVWFDGNCHIPVADILEKYASEAVIFQGKQATIRWVGNEDGYAPDPNWYTVKRSDMEGGGATAVHSDVDGDVYAPVEVDVPFLKNGGHKWFWAPGTDSLILTVDQLTELYFNSVGRGSVLLLNASPDTTGQIPAAHVQRYREFGDTLHSYFDSPLAQTRGRRQQLVCRLPAPQPVNCVVMRERVEDGQRVLSYRVEGTRDGQNWELLSRGTSVGNRKIDRFPTREVSVVRFVIDSCKARPAIELFSVYRLPEKAIEASSPAHATVTVAGWEHDTYPTDRWTEMEIDLTPYVNRIGQYELVFRTTGYDYADNRPAGLEVTEPRLEMYGTDMSEALQRVEGENRFIITRSQQTLGDFPTLLRIKVRSHPCKSIGVVSLQEIRY